MLQCRRGVGLISISLSPIDFDLKRNGIWEDEDAVGVAMTVTVTVTVTEWRGEEGGDVAPLSNSALMAL